MEALGNALGGGGSGHQVKLKGNFANEAQINCCVSVGAGATFQNNRVVFNSGSESLEEKKPSTFKRLCCCCCRKKKEKGAKAENRKTIEMFERYLEEQYGSTNGDAASLYARIDLDKRHDEGRPLRRKHVEQITLAARTIQESEPRLASSLYDIQSRSQPDQGKGEDLDPFAGVTDFTPYVREVLQVHISDDKNYWFTDKKTNGFSGRAVNAWVKDNVLCSYSFNWELSRANEFIARVKYAIKQVGNEYMITSEVKKIINQQLAVMGIRATSPSFMERIPDTGIRESIRTKAQTRGPDLSNLNGPEIAELMRALQAAQSRV